MESPSESTSDFYEDVKLFLQQADIFKLDIVSPISDTQKRIFRSADGQHGSVYFEGSAQAKVFDESELTSLLSRVSRNPLHTEPFGNTPNGDPEMVVVGARKHKYFIIASQTCDISGEDSPPLQLATLLPIITIFDICRAEKLPLIESKPDEFITIHDFVISNYEGDKESLIQCDEYMYGSEIRTIMTEWLKSKPSGEVGKIVSRIKNYINNKFAGKSLFMYLLAEDQKREIPESYIDFSMIFTVPTFQLEELKEFRIGRLQELYNADYVKKFSNFFERVALPRPMKAPKI